jgi:3-deoxy-D-manno-octulosonate 8-phosphate phosphatase (KDO 8-P phosphatase)
MSKARAKKIKLLLLDVDGVMTDGTIFLFPAVGGSQNKVRPHRDSDPALGGYGIGSDTVVEAKGFNAHDGTAMSLAHLGGLKIGLITKRVSETVRLRARDLKIEYVYQGAADKLSCFREILQKEKLTPEQTAYVGDDIIDLPVMREVGLAIAVANAREDVKDESHIITDHRGGDGAVRDAVEYILKAQGTYDKCVNAYISDRTPADKKQQ